MKCCLKCKHAITNKATTTTTMIANKLSGCCCCCCGSSRHHIFDMSLRFVCCLLVVVWHYGTQADNDNIPSHPFGISLSITIFHTFCMFRVNLKLTCYCLKSLLFEFVMTGIHTHTHTQEFPPLSNHRQCIRCCS